MNQPYLDKGGLIPPAGTEHELWNTPWMRKTFQTDKYINFDPGNDIMLPVILYLDKTGTDVNQRYSLEPVLFSLAAIPREQRESRHSWHHFGFVPQKHGCSEEESSSDLQLYHDCLSYLLDGLREAQNNPPRVSFKLNDGGMVHRRALLPLMVVLVVSASQTRHHHGILYRNYRSERVVPWDDHEDRRPPPYHKHQMAVDVFSNPYFYYDQVVANAVRKEREFY